MASVDALPNLVARALWIDIVGGMCNLIRLGIRDVFAFLFGFFGW